MPACFLLLSKRNQEQSKLWWLFGAPRLQLPFCEAALHMLILRKTGLRLQIKLERLPEIARAFVHIDYETSHEPEHKIH